MTLEQIRPGVWRCVLHSMPDRLLAAAACATIHAARPWWMRMLAPWTRRAWVTIGTRVYLPADERKPWMRPSAVEHELTHVRQWLDFGPLLWLAYLGWPLPVGLAWTRYIVEREAYGAEVRHHGASPGLCAEALCSPLYLWTWPRRWALAYFERLRTTAR